MKLQAGKQYLDGRDNKWTIDYVGNKLASGHNQTGNVRTWCNDGKWICGCTLPEDLIAEYNEPEFVPWETPQEVPAKAWFRRKDRPNNWVQAYQILVPKESKDMITSLSSIGQVLPIELLREFEHSLDNGVTWLPCGKEKK